MLVRVDHAALEGGEYVLDRVRVHDGLAFATGLLLRCALDGAMSSVLHAGLGVEAAIVGVEGGVAGDILYENVADGSGRHLVQVEHAGLAAALDQPDHDALVGAAGLPSFDVNQAVF